MDNNKTPDFTLLGEDVWGCILSFLSYPQIAKMESVCKMTKPYDYREYLPVKYHTFMNHKKILKKLYTGEWCDKCEIKEHLIIDKDNNVSYEETKSTGCPICSSYIPKTKVINDFFLSERDLPQICIIKPNPHNPKTKMTLYNVQLIRRISIEKFGKGNVEKYNEYVIRRLSDRNRRKKQYRDRILKYTEDYQDFTNKLSNRTRKILLDRLLNINGIEPRRVMYDDLYSDFVSGNSRDHVKIVASKIIILFELPFEEVIDIEDQLDLLPWNVRDSVDTMVATGRVIIETNELRNIDI